MIMNHIQSNLCTMTTFGTTKLVAAVDMWLSFGGHLCYKRFNWDLKLVVVVDRLGVHYSEVVVSSGLTVYSKNLSSSS